MSGSFINFRAIPNIQVIDTTPSTSTTTGALTVAGGLGVGGALWAGSGIVGGSLSLTSPGATNTIPGITNVTNTTPSTSTATGALTVAGGLGVGGALFVGSVNTDLDATVGANLRVAPTTLAIRSASGQTRDISFRSGNSERWNIRATAAAETGGNSGTLFQIIARDDAGILIDAPLTITRAAGGFITLSRSVTAPQYRLSALNTAPASATDTGTTGEIRIDANYIYVCIATNTWRRAALTNW